MKKYIVAALLATIGSGGHASTVHRVDLSLRVDAVGYRDVKIEDKNDGSTQTFPFLTLADAEQFNFESTIPSVRYPVGEIISFSATLPSSSATLPSSSRQLENCSLGGVSCVGAFGGASSTRVSIGDSTEGFFGGDSYFSVGVNPGDTGRLLVGTGSRYWEFLDSPDNNVYATWDSYEHQFTVVTQVPLPATSFLLLGGVLTSWLVMVRRPRSRKLQCPIG